MFTSHAPGFIAANAAASIIPRDVGVSGVASTT